MMVLFNILAPNTGPASPFRSDGMCVTITNYGRECDCSLDISIDGSNPVRTEVKGMRQHETRVVIPRPFEVHLETPKVVPVTVSVVVGDEVCCRTSGMRTVLPSGFFDPSDRKLMKSITEWFIPTYDWNNHSDEETVQDVYESLSYMETVEDTGVMIHVHDYETIVTEGKGTPLEISMAYASKLVSMNMDVCIVNLGGKYLVGHMEQNVVQHDRPNILEKHTFIEPSKGCDGIPYTVNKDVTQTCIRRMSPLLNEDRDIAFVNSSA